MRGLGQAGIDHGLGCTGPSLILVRAGRMGWERLREGALTGGGVGEGANGLHTACSPSARCPPRTRHRHPRVQTNYLVPKCRELLSTGGASGLGHSNPRQKIQYHLKLKQVGRSGADGKRSGCKRGSRTARPAPLGHTPRAGVHKPHRRARTRSMLAATCTRARSTWDEQTRGVARNRSWRSCAMSAPCCCARSSSLSNASGGARGGGKGGAAHVRGLCVLYVRRHVPRVRCGAWGVVGSCRCAIAYEHMRGLQEARSWCCLLRRRSPRALPHIASNP